MESFSYLLRFGAIVRKERNALHLNQVEFYKYLFPDTTKQDENIKKKMNIIENGKQASVDIDLFLALCDKCDVSADYLLGMNPFRNHDIESICKYTGLSENAVRQLHTWQNDANNGGDISRIGNAFWSGEEERQMNLAYAKLNAIQYLKILNCLFSESETKDLINGKKRTEKYSNVGVLYSLHLLCITKPYRILGKPMLNETLGEGYEYYLEHNPYLQRLFDQVSLNAAEDMILQDENDVWYPINMNTVFEQIARNHLNKSLDRLIESIKKEFGDSQNSDAVHHRHNEQY